MHQPLSDESLLLQTNPIAALDPLLKRALGVLDARLEDELSRYRRYRAGKRVTPSAATAMQRAHQSATIANPSAKPGGKRTLSLDLLQTVSAPPKVSAAAPPKVNAAAPPKVNAAAPPKVNAAAVSAAGLAAGAAASLAATQTDTATSRVIPPPPRTPVSIQNTGSTQTAADAGEPIATANLPSTHRFAGLDEDITLGQPDASEPSESGHTEAGGAVVPLLSIDDFSQTGFAPDYGNDYGFAVDAPPNDYLASSEELLRSLAEEEAGAAAERSVLDGLLTPFGVGSMLLMLLGSGMFGYLIMNPSSLTALQGLADRVANFRRPVTSATNVDVDGTDIGHDISWMSNAPALDSGEFLNLNLNNFSALRTRPGGSNNGLILLPTAGKAGQSPLQKLGKNNQAKAGPVNKNGKAKVGPGLSGGITGFTPLNIQPIVPPGPAIASSGGSGLFAPPVKVSGSSSSDSNSYGGGSYSGGGYSAPAPRIEPAYEPPRRPARSYEPAPAYNPPAYNPPAYTAPARNVEPVYNPPPVKVLPPAPVVEAPVAEAIPEPQGEYRVVAPYTNDSDLETAQKASADASFRNLDDGAYVQYGGAYSSKAEADAKASELKQQGVEVEIK
jgi:hypothetical protein